MSSIFNNNNNNNIFILGSLVKFHTMPTKNKKKRFQATGYKGLFLGKKGAKSPHIKGKKSLKEPYFDNRFLENNK